MQTSYLNTCEKNTVVGGQTPQTDIIPPGSVHRDGRSAGFTSVVTYLYNCRLSWRTVFPATGARLLGMGRASFSARAPEGSARGICVGVASHAIYFSFVFSEAIVPL